MCVLWTNITQESEDKPLDDISHKFGVVSDITSNLRLLASSGLGDCLESLWRRRG